MVAILENEAFLAGNRPNCVKLISTVPFFIDRSLPVSFPFILPGGRRSFFVNENLYQVRIGGKPAKGISNVI